ncbi:MAG TPA: formylmethanofuran dehydrogenase subunit A [Firmicutes bacterium]|nr:formylmethanofuran dehydrogenase subunit A [Bacillota bacterium]
MHKADGVMRSGSGVIVPTTHLTGYRYSRMGYTTVFDPATAPLMARHAMEELRDIPGLDKGYYVLIGNNHFVLKFIKEKNFSALKNYLAWLLEVTKGFAFKIVNPGGLVNWKRGGNTLLLDDQVDGYEITPREIIAAAVQANEELGIPHPIHLGCNSVGLPGNFLVALDTMRTIEDQRIHLTHLQFHSYGVTRKGGITSEALPLAEYINAHPRITADAGQIVFGPAITMSADGPLEYSIAKMTNTKWCNYDVEMETSSGVVPLTYREENLANGVQWAIGLELLLLIKNPWQIFLTTDHPNGGPFTAYPSIIKLLMDKGHRDESLARLHKKTAMRTVLAEITREYSLGEIAVITRAGPARILGLKHKGHLGVGADADIAIYRDIADREKMFAVPEYVFKDGELIVHKGVLLCEKQGRVFRVAPAWERDFPQMLKADFERYYTIAMRNYEVEEAYLPHCEVVPCL